MGEKLTKCWKVRIKVSTPSVCQNDMLCDRGMPSAECPLF